MKDVLIKRWGSQFLLPIACCLLLSIAAVSQAASISGTVTGTVPIENVDVWVCINPCGESDWKAHDFTDVSGVYDITGLIDGQDYKVKFFTNEVPQYIAEWYNDQFFFVDADPVTATDAGTGEIDAVLGASSEITGVVTSDGVTPLAGVNVYAKYGDEWIASAVTTAELDSNGNNYTCSGLSSAISYNIFFYADNIGYLNEWYDDQPDDGSVTVPAGATAASGGATVNAVLAAQSNTNATAHLIPVYMVLGLL